MVNHQARYIELNSAYGLFPPSRRLTEESPTTPRTQGSSGQLPPPAGPYSASIRIGSIAVCAGQGARSPEGLMAEGIKAQTRQTLDNVLAALGAVGATADDVAQVRVCTSPIRSTLRQ